MVKTSVATAAGVVLAAGLFLAVAATPASATAINVAATANGGSISGSAGLNGAALSTLIDGQFVPRSTQWQTGTVWWHGLSPFVEISFQQPSQLRGLIVEADDNDAYTVLYDDGGAWQTLWNVPNYDGYGWGMQTRPNVNNTSEMYLLPAPVTTSRIRVQAAGGDNSYSLAEVQAYGTPVPVPAAAWLLGSGLAGLAAWRSRRRS
ncbi:MAG: VPLPA-CTERM sorting domain-containing protein [Thermodesulfobacteriota bacterium]